MNSYQIQRNKLVEGLKSIHCNEDTSALILNQISLIADSVQIFDYPNNNILSSDKKHLALFKDDSNSFFILNNELYLNLESFTDLYHMDSIDLKMELDNDLYCHCLENKNKDEESIEHGQEQIFKSYQKKLSNLDFTLNKLILNINNICRPCLGDILLTSIGLFRKVGPIKFLVEKELNDIKYIDIKDKTLLSKEDVEQLSSWQYYCFHEKLGIFTSWKGVYDLKELELESYSFTIVDNRLVRFIPVSEESFNCLDEAISFLKNCGSSELADADLPF